MDKLFERLPRIIAEAARTRWGILALVIATFSIIGMIFSSDAPVAVRIAMFVFMSFVFMSSAFAGFVLLAFTRHPPSEQNEKGGLRAKADETLEDAEKLRLSGSNDRARSAYEEARTLFKQVGDRLGEANVLSGLGGLEAEAEPELAKQHLYQAANIYESIDLEEQKRTALDEAAKLGR